MHVFNQIILVLAMIFVLSCSQQFQITTKLSANISDPVFTPDNNTTTSQILSPTKQNLSIIKSQNICMNNAGLSVSAGELFFDVKQYIKGQQEGISVRVHKQFNLLPGWYDITPLSEESTEESRKPVLIFDQPDINRNNLQDLINKKRLELDLTSLEDGNYSLHVYTPGNASRTYDIPPFLGVAGEKMEKFYFAVSRGKVVSQNGFLRLLYDINRENYNLNGQEDPHSGPISSCDVTSSPLIIDLSGLGITLSPPLQGVEFDILGTKSKKQISWPINSTSAFLVLDVNQNGIIDDVNELFGNNTIGPDGQKASNGFDALRKYDLNKDGIIDQNDEIYFKLKLWIDINRDGVSVPTELYSMKDVGIESINLNYASMEEEDIYGNKTLQRSLVKLFNGEFRKIFDIWFRLI